MGIHEETRARAPELRRRWLAGETTAEIGRAMGISKNAVVGQVHRLGLPGRPSPIIRGGEPRPPRPKREHPATALPALASLAEMPKPALPPERGPGGRPKALEATTVALAPEPAPLNRMAQRRAPIRGATLSPRHSAEPAKVPAPVIVTARERCRFPMWADWTSYRETERLGRKLWCDKPVRMKRNPAGDQVPCVYCPEHAEIAFTRSAPGFASNRQIEALAEGKILRGRGNQRTVEPLDA